MPAWIIALILAMSNQTTYSNTCVSDATVYLGDGSKSGMIVEYCLSVVTIDPVIVEPEFYPRDARFIAN